jgi:hypothetical protein
MKLGAHRIEHHSLRKSSVIAFVFITAVTYLPSRCLATIQRYTLTRLIYSFIVGI